MSHNDYLEHGDLNHMSELLFGDFTDQEVAALSDWSCSGRKGVEFLRSYDVAGFDEVSKTVYKDGKCGDTHEGTLCTGPALPETNFDLSSSPKSCPGNTELPSASCSKTDTNFNSIENNCIVTTKTDLESAGTTAKKDNDLCCSAVGDLSQGSETVSNYQGDAIEQSTCVKNDSVQADVSVVTSGNATDGCKDQPSTTNIAPKPEIERPAPKTKPTSWAALFKTEQPRSTTSNEPINRKAPSSKSVVDSRAPSQLHFAHTHLGSSKQFIPVERDSRLERLVSFVQNFKFADSKEPFLMRGLVNRGNWCYINATLQVLISTSPFFHLFRSADVFMDNESGKSAIPLIDCMALFVNKFVEWETESSANKKNGKEKAGSSFVPQEVYDVLPLLKSNLSEKGRQEDAEEFLSFLLNGLHDEFAAISATIEPEPSLNNMSHSAPLPNGDVEETDDSNDDWEHVGPKNRSTVLRNTACKSSLVRMIFGGTVRSSVHRSGSKESASLQPFFTLQLDIQSDDIHDVKEALELYFAKKSLVDFTCSKTNAEVEAFHKTCLEELPWVLILHLKYFVFDKTGGSQKLHKAIDIYPDLEIPRDVLSTSVRSKIAAQQRMYKLLGVVYHHGKNAAGGHYTAAVRQGGKGGWMLCDDSILKPIQLASVIKHQQDRVPYLLLYERTKLNQP